MNISVSSVRQKYGSHVVLKDISFESKSGEVLALLGPNGSGKSTLIKTIADILAPSSGSITIDGTDVQKIDPIDRAKMIGYVPQYFHYTPFTTVLDTVLIGRRPYMSWSVSDEDLAAVDEAMATMNIADLSDRFVNELSGGQRQRVFIARALETVATMREIVRRENSGMIIALHDLNLALRYTDKVLLLKDGEMYAYGTPEEVLTTESVRDVYGVDAEFVENAKGRFILSYAPS